MSAVATAEAASVSELAPATVGPSTYEIQAAEQKRWLVWIGIPALVASLFVGLTFATGDAWWLGLAISAILADIFALVWLAMSSDTNAIIGEPSSH
jgi:hypothetical protein